GAGPSRDVSRARLRARLRQERLERAGGPRGAPAKLARAHEHLGVRLPAGSEELLLAVGQRALVRGAQQVAAEDLRALVVEDRHLDGALEEVLGVAREELVERVLARQV